MRILKDYSYEETYSIDQPWKRQFHTEVALHQTHKTKITHPRLSAIENAGFPSTENAQNAI